MVESKDMQPSSHQRATCLLDPRHATALLIKAREGHLSRREKSELLAHLERCPQCKEDYESLADTEMEMLVAAHDENELRKFDPEPTHAERCLLATTERLERFAQGTSERELIADDELEDHLDTCVYCRRRSISAARRVRYPDRVPLVYRLSEQALAESVNEVGQRVWRAVVDSSVPVPTALAALAGNRLVLSSGICVEIDRFSRTLYVHVTGLKDAEGRKVLLITRDEREIAGALNADGLAQFVDVPDGKYPLSIYGVKRGLTLVLAEGNVHVWERNEPTSSETRSPDLARDS